MKNNIETFTIGFTKKSAEEFFTKLREAGVRRLIDVRLNNVSQLAGFAKRDDLAYFLRAIGGIEYLHVRELAPTKEILEVYRKEGRDWEVYADAFLNLMEQRDISRSVGRDLIDGGCLLCSEHLPDHCHRRLVVEYLDECWGGVAATHIV